MSLTDTILIVDDSSFIVDGLVSILKKSYRPLAVYGGQQCLEILKTEIPSIIILDIMMEPMDGWETLARIKDNPVTRHIPVLMFSAKKISAEEADEHRISIDDFVSKPVTPKKLIEAIEKVLLRQKANRASIESWRSAGIGQDRIDEYTSLITSREVDMSLLQNMKVQHSLLREDDDKTRTHLETVISAIEGRIEEEQRHEEKLSRDMQDSVVKDAEEKERAGSVPAMVVWEEMVHPVHESADATTQPELMGFDDINEGRKNPSEGEFFVPVVDVPYEETPPESSTIPDSSLSESFFEGYARDDEPEKKMPAESLITDPEPNPVPSGISERTEIPKTPSATSPFPPESSMGNSIDGVNDTSSGQIFPGAEQKQSTPHETHPTITRTLDNKPLGPDAPLSPAFGSGTDISFRNRPNSIGRSYGHNESAGKEKNVPEKDATPLQGSFISRIISTIIGLFKRPEK